jgi:hypothetical protein
MITQAQLTVTQTPTGTPLPGNAANAIHAWYRGGNTNTPTTNNVFGTFWNSEVHHYTGGIWRWTSSTNNGLNNSNFNSSLSLAGDGISIRNNGSNSGSFASIDLFTSQSNSTVLRMGRGFLMQTVNSRTEMIGNYNGMWYNATNVWGGTPQYIWNINQNEFGRLNHLGRWRFGPNGIFQPGNRVEIAAATTDPYGTNGSGLRFKYLTAANAVTPNGVNGVQSNKVLTVDVNGDVVLTTPILSPVVANNGLQVSGGIVQLGGWCGSSSEVFNSRLLNTRKIWLRNNDLLFEQVSPPNGLAPGRIGIGDMPQCTVPGNLVEIVKNRTVPNAAGLSGLRLFDLKAGAGINPPNGRALSVNNNGDVILVSATGSGSGNVNSCGPIPINNVVKHIGGDTICQTNITDLFPIPFVGINNTTPNDALDVSPLPGSATGDIDVTDPNHRYEINDNPVLWHKNNVNDIFVGVGAALNSSVSNNNTIVGHNASSVGNNIGINHTMIGADAGANHTFGMDYTFIGYRAGWGHPGQLYTNTFVGAYSGEMEAGAENVYVGWSAGNNPSGSISFHNTFLGNRSGYNISTGNGNSFLGFNSGLNNTIGNNNTCLGDNADLGASNLNNATAVGSSAIVMANDQMILGNNSVNVGIGLSGIAGGPGNKLEINTPAPTAIPGASGLRFTDLNTTSIPLPNPGPGVLSVDPNGDVIYVQGGTGGGTINACGPLLTDNVVKAVGPNTICGTNITDLSTGSVGINNTIPNDALDVSPGILTTGDIDVTSSSNGYEIKDQKVLWHKGNTTNILVGVGAATNDIGGQDNVVVGNDAAALGTNIGTRLTIIGKEAGYNLGVGGFGLANDYTFVGYRAGYDNLGNSTNTFIGSEAGYHDLGDENVYVGWKSGFGTPGQSSVHNTFVGNVTGLNNQTGSNNTFLGIGSGWGNVSGHGNIAIGAGAGFTSGALQNTIAIGQGSQGTTTNSMILGDNTVNVGIGLSGVAGGPGNKLEINTPALSPVPGASGLRFTDLTAISTPIPNPGPGLLGVNINGDVVYVSPPTGGGGGGVGNYCGSLPNPLLTNYEVPLNQNDYFFRDDATNTNRVGVGYTCLGGLQGKLNAITAFPTDGTGNSYGVHSLTTNGTVLSVNTGVYGEANSPGLSTDAFGVWGKATASSRKNYGVYGQGGQNPFSNTFGGYFEALQNGNSKNTGVHGEAENSFGVNIGVEGIGHPSTFSYGGVFDAISLSSNLECIGVTGRGFQFSSSAPPTYPSSCRIGVYGQTQNVVGDFAGFFDGNLWVNGISNGTGYVLTSDRKFKKDIETLTGGLDIIRKLKPRTYHYDVENKWQMRFDDRKQYGFIAQELEEVLPELVTDLKKPAMLDKEGKTVTEAVDFKGVNMDGLISVLVKSVQELEEQNAKQTQLIEALTDRLNGMGATGSTSRNPVQTTTLGDGNIIVLNQNVPNPFSHKTVIGYNIPEHAAASYIYFYSNDGKLIQQTLLTQKGKGELVVYANNLSVGNYTYSLVVDGKVIDSKKMTLASNQ